MEDETLVTDDGSIISLYDNEVDLSVEELLYLLRYIDADTNL